MKYKYPGFLSYLLVILLLYTGCAKQNIFTEPPDHPVIDSISPSAGFTGTQIRLWGSGFSTFSSRDTVRINGVSLRVDSPSTSTVMLATLIDSTGTGIVTVTVNGQSGQGPVFTYLSRGTGIDAPVITSADFGWNDGRGYAVSVKTLPASDNGIRVLVGGVNAPIAFVVRPGDPRYDPNKGNQILLQTDSIVLNHADGIYANFMVTFNGVPSNTYPYQLNPVITDMFSSHGSFKFAAGDTLTIRGKFFGDRTQLPSSITMVFNGVPLNQPTILSWSNTTITAAMPAYPTVPVNSGIPIGVKVGSKSPLQGSSVIYLAVVTGPPATGGVFTKIDYSGTSTFSESRKYLAAASAGSRIIFAGGTNTGYSRAVDIYNAVTGVWSTAQLSEARFNLAAAAAGSKIVFAGGFSGAGYSSAVDIYDTLTNAWTTAQLSVARSSLAAAAAGNKIYFAGGETNRGTTGSSKVIDIYDVTSNTWSTGQLSEERAQLAGAATGNKLIFAGGHNAGTGADSRTADILDITTNTWTTALLPGGARYQLGGAGAGNKIVFGGGISNLSGTALKNVDIYDVTTNTWSTDQLSVGRWAPAAVAAGNKIVFAGGFDGGPAFKISTFDIYDVVSKTWVAGQLSEGKGGMAGAAAGNKMLFGGGETNTAVGVSNTVEIFTLSN
ncbi:MAG: IPT/TIG domain-containing protein [Chitinophagaceae bacterium]